MVDNSEESSLLKVQTVALENTPKAVFIAPSARILRQIKNSIETQIGHSLESKGLLADSIPWFEHSDYVLVGPTLGSAGIILGLTPFLEIGAKTVAFIGLAGAFQSTINIADYISPIATHSKCPHASVHRIQCDESKRLTLFPRASAIHLAQIVSVSNPYSTTKNDIAQWLNSGCAAVEMELYTLCSLQQNYRFSLHAALVVSDIITPTVGQQPQFNSKKVKSASQKLAESYVQKLCS